MRILNVGNSAAHLGILLHAFLEAGGGAEAGDTLPMMTMDEYERLQAACALEPPSIDWTTGPAPRNRHEARAQAALARRNRR